MAEDEIIDIYAIAKCKHTLTKNDKGSWWGP